MLLLIASAVAGSVFLTMSEPSEIDVGGNWVRVFAGDGGWHVTNAGGGAYNYAWMSDSLEVDRATRTTLTERTNLLDHGLAACPDGTFLHFASATTDPTNPDDTIYSFRYDGSFAPMYSAIVAEADPNGTNMDPPAVCASWIQAVGHMTVMPLDTFVLVHVDDTLTVLGRSVLEEAGEAPGGGLYADDDHLWAVGSLDRHWSGLHVSQYDTNLQLEGVWDVDVAPPGQTAYWYQKVDKVGDCFIVAHMMREDGLMWAAQTGNAYLTAFDADWKLIDQLAITAVAAPKGAFYPWFDRKEDQLVVSYHAEEAGAEFNAAVTVTIDLDLCESTEPVDTGDTGEPDDTGETGVPDDTGDSGDPLDSGDSGDSGDSVDTAPAIGDPPDDCGCNTTAAGAPGLLLPLVALARRRRARA